VGSSALSEDPLCRFLLLNKLVLMVRHLFVYLSVLFSLAISSQRAGITPFFSLVSLVPSQGPTSNRNFMNAEKDKAQNG
jgi:hypothetical protein